MRPSTSFRFLLDGLDQVADVVTAGSRNLNNLATVVFDPNELTLHQAVDATALEPDLPISSISAAGLSAKSPLIVKAPEKKSKVALVLQSNATIEEKESLLEDFLQAKDREMQAKDREMQAKDSLLEELKEKLRGIESERDFLKGMLNACSILEKYEKRFKDKNLSRTQNWKMHLDRNPALKARLQECDKNIAWHDKVVDIYKHLSEIVHQDTSRLGGSRFLVMIRKNLPEIDVCFIQAIAEQIYGEHVRVNAKADEED
ncbi:hypothetical protein BATDEDRAFT_92793 [Batrachochytrium dendrobatidis JAM81]|uniref:Uncharacterized protein n=1 Tax=Batrachochytrium dendrobatidis (strain JAM81 / FGSC 10211) TaxID=684364 RepID=F4PEJ2_BATDJ|nr:uncharacterized protein BATDEDRAFT_92793 [Batrachochytrium dendrobatidis JAM81]EGF76383.1 hypothetical protein BATDEDRAFT_92793 [Batrachochytrium dendrobatidis JAM81]|eukprot:XP_006683006.1 hypothetical protein BATDEDRAFT_92793 [Batrachochytrium dendrobatidis JAM81]